MKELGLSLGPIDIPQGLETYLEGLGTYPESLWINIEGLVTYSESLWIFPDGLGTYKISSSKWEEETFT